jgi:hypothetical protein
MKTTSIKSFLTLLILGWTGMTLQTFAADPLDPALQARVDAQVKAIQVWAGDPVIVSAVKAQNASLPADYAAMTQDKWQALSILDPFVRSFSKNAVGQFLAGKKTPLIAEAFVSDASGRKVGFTSKTTNWSHAGKAKHDVPMTGKTWQGVIELDASSGLQALQVSVPVLDGDKPIGSIVVGLSISNLKE